ncbi:unnamed protein product [Fusarium fujikuroi]|uniref:Uncharacterized protein n=1 Tax=Fusarium fujikuroi TaxID=5127 RepID=A0A2H3SFF1_FUSFU|nr:uncharacterized protein FFC1_12279 [Fusarium fujikuroi]VTT68349.1 unnamed protein product [Fusarium fujikuroi]VTT75185.1 unnamed protein product [Fusarium fujikuroi]
MAVEEPPNRGFTLYLRPVLSALSRQILTTLENHPWTYETTSEGKITVVYAEPAQDLCALSRVSHRLRDVAQPVLYHEFPNFEHRERRLEPFLDTVTFRTDLARAVKVMAWNSNLANDLDIVRAQTGYHQGLKALGIDENQLWPDDECDMFLSPSALKVYGVNSIKLRELLATDLPHVILDVAPDLNHLVIGHFNPRNIYSPGSSKKPRTIGYLMSEQDFKLEEASPYRLDTRDLEKILTSRGQPLRRFRFETSRIKTKVDVPRISFSYLDNFCTTLESLHLEYDVDARLFGSTIRSLKKFTSLKEIFITANLIYSIREDDDPTRDAKSLVNFLPDQIEIFTEIDWTAPPFEHQPLARGFDGLLDAMIQGSFPKLRRVRGGGLDVEEVETAWAIF